MTAAPTDRELAASAAAFNPASGNLCQPAISMAGSAKGACADARFGKDLGCLLYKTKSQISLALGDKVVYALTRALRRAMRPTFSSLLEPHYKQDLSANPKRAAQSSE
jgi:hypothetical protein